MRALNRHHCTYNGRIHALWDTNLQDHLSRIVRKSLRDSIMGHNSSRSFEPHCTKKPWDSIAYANNEYSDIHAVSPEPSLFKNRRNHSRGSFNQRTRHRIDSINGMVRNVISECDLSLTLSKMLQKCPRSGSE